jgi:hypothetical protein
MNLLRRLYYVMENIARVDILLSETVQGGENAVATINWSTNN